MDWDEMTEEQLEDLMRQAGESSPEEGLEELPEGEEMRVEIQASRVRVTSPEFQP